MPDADIASNQQAYRDLKKRFKLPRRIRRPVLWLAFVAGVAVVCYECWVAFGLLFAGAA